MPRGVYPRKKKEVVVGELVRSLKPELQKLAEGEIAVAFVENPELVADVKEKVADVLLTRGGRQVIGSSDALTYLKKNLGVELAAVLCSMDQKKYVKFLAGTEDPTTTQARNIAAAYVIADILLSALPTETVIEWLTEYSNYLYGIPAIEIFRRPDDVRTAALNRVMRGEEEAVY
jgi:hypothetical protein